MLLKFTLNGLVKEDVHPGDDTMSSCNGVPGSNFHMVRILALGDFRTKGVGEAGVLQPHEGSTAWLNPAQTTCLALSLLGSTQRTCSTDPVRVFLVSGVPGTTRYSRPFRESYQPVMLSSLYVIVMMPLVLSSNLHVSVMVCGLPACLPLVLLAAAEPPGLSLAAEEAADGKSAILLGMSQWNSNDLVEQIETIGRLEECPGDALTGTFSRQGNLEGASAILLLVFKKAVLLASRPCNPVKRISESLSTTFLASVSAGSPHSSCLSHTFPSTLCCRSDRMSKAVVVVPC